MREKRNLKVHYISDYNELVKAISEKELVIYVEGSLYEEIKKEIKKEKREYKSVKGIGKLNVLFGGITLATEVSLLGPIMLGAGAVGYLCGKLAEGSADFNKYKIVDNRNEKRLEMLRVKGTEIPVDLKYDTIIV